MATPKDSPKTMVTPKDNPNTMATPKDSPKSLYYIPKSFRYFFVSTIIAH